jgi:flagellar basal body-associated protein FliL
MPVPPIAASPLEPQPAQTTELPFQPVQPIQNIAPTPAEYPPTQTQQTQFQPTQPAFQPEPAYQPAQPIQQPETSFQPTQQATPFQQPASMPTPYPTPIGQPVMQPQMQTGYGVPPAKKNRMLLMIILIVATVLIVAGVAAALYFFVFNGVKLKSYTATNYTVNVPVDFEATVTGDSITFMKKGADKTNTSTVVTYYAGFPSVTTSQLTTLRSSFKTSLETQLKESASASGKTLGNLSVTDGKHNGADAFVITAKVSKNGTEIGNIKAVAVVNINSVYEVAVSTLKADSALAAKADDIINSFKLK